MKTDKKQADALIAHGLKDVGYLYINVDDGFFGWRDETGKMHAHPERFPNGMRPISDYIHSLGLKAGIYSDAGDNTCGSIYDNDANGVGSGLYGHEQQDMDLYLKEWNYDFIKIDYCGGRELGLDEENVTQPFARLSRIPDAPMFPLIFVDGLSQVPGPKAWRVPGVSARMYALVGKP